MTVGRKTGGRQKGTPNRTTTAIKDAFKEAFDDMGGVQALVKWGKANPGQFYPLAARLIPTEVNGNVAASLTIELVRFSEPKDD